jgi:F-type H+-transporting ATPase subunit b
MSLDINITYVLVLALFLAPLAILNGIVFRPFLKLFEERHEQLEGAVKRAEEMLDQAEQRAKTFEAKIQVATHRGMDARNALRAKAAAEMAARVDAERKRLAEKVAAALQDLEKKRREALADVTVEAERIARSTAEKLLGRSLSL